MGLFEKEIKQSIVYYKRIIKRSRAIGANKMVEIFKRNLAHAEESLLKIKNGSPEAEAYQFFLFGPNNK